MSILESEIDEQPRVLAQLLDGQRETAARIAAEIRDRNVQFAMFAARGTSDNAARYGRYLFGALNGLPVALATPSLFSIYKKPPRIGDALVVGISQSGESPDIVAVVEEARRQGALTVTLTNTPQSALAAAAAHVLPLEAGVEQAVAATKTYTSELLALALLSVHLANDAEYLKALQAVPAAVRAAVELKGEIARFAQRYTYANECVVLGRGFNHATAFEIALKLEELTHIVTEPYSSADFRHGPVAIVEHSLPVVAVAPRGRVLPDIVALLRELRERQAELIVISDAQHALELGRTRLVLPVTVPEWLSPVTAVVPGQLLALYVALAKGYDPDQPRGLRKVTRTR
jgi:glucosamine--fructose-6-phosphate aminotransferase (isomerizing)